MLRNRNRNMLGMLAEGNYVNTPVPPQPAVNQLDAKDERLVDLSETVGQLGAQNDMLNEDNRRLEQKVKDLSERNSELQKRNTELERQHSADSAAYKSGQKLVDEIESALKDRKSSK
jgi:predicted nuclease with TOPRIM domain